MIQGNYAKRIGTLPAVYMAAVLEYLCADIFDAAGDETKKAQKQRITPRHIMLAVRKDQELNELLKDVTISEAGVLPLPQNLPENKRVERAGPSQEF